MSIRDELAAVIRSKYDQHRVDRYPTEGALADWILDRFAVVALPEPDGIADPDGDYPGLAEWNTELGRVGAFDDGDGFIDMEPLRLMNVSPGALRELAASLLAAANRAEAQP